ncbi:hook-length control protein FliK [Cognatiyoonia koreensis]|uniref:Hook-length control protein FliK n=1 Tax=Cognatiyoonia koreensis TaxID=364200 RepID=A0A1I0RK40_9RHOB|nr:flagellar hook-length control protein FliK [Cognatiyoonia koreensis]SEW41169.1 hook-length control protein FliK [Cognatiyoonia koreensis]
MPILPVLQLTVSMPTSGVVAMHPDVANPTADFAAVFAMNASSQQMIPAGFALPEAELVVDDEDGAAEEALDAEPETESDENATPLLHAASDPPVSKKPASEIAVASASPKTEQPALTLKGIDAPVLPISRPLRDPVQRAPSPDQRHILEGEGTVTRSKTAALLTKPEKEGVKPLHVVKTGTQILFETRSQGERGTIEAQFVQTTPDMPQKAGIAFGNKTAPRPDTKVHVAQPVESAEKPVDTPRDLPTQIRNDRPNDPVPAATTTAPANPSIPVRPPTDVPSAAVTDPTIESEDLAISLTAPVQRDVVTPTIPPVQANLPAPAAQHIAGQMAVAILQNGPGTTEITLSPEELGKVRMVVAAHDTAITVTIQAERPETHELLRRQIDALAQEFRNMGFGSISFAFQGGQRGQANDAQSDLSEAETPPLPHDAPPIAATGPAKTGSGLDLRL